MRVAPAFQLRIVPSSVFPMMASSEESTIAASQASGRSPGSLAARSSNASSPERGSRIESSRESSQLPEEIYVGLRFGDYDPSSARLESRTQKQRIDTVESFSRCNRRSTAKRHRVGRR